MNKAHILFSLLLMLIFGVRLYSQKNRSKPNVLFIAVDDLNDWIGVYGGHPQTITPNLDAIAKKGVIFTNAQCAVSVCNPSRTAIMTGIRASTSGIYQNNQLFRESELLKDIQTIPQYFASFGYETLAKGKIFHHPEGIFADAKSWHDMQLLSGNEMNNHPDQKDDVNANGMPVKNTFQRGLDWGSFENVQAEESADFHTADWAANELLQKHDKPFFIGCGIFRPHLPWFLPKKYFDKFPLDKIVLPEINEEDLNDIPKIGKDMSGGLDPERDYIRVKKYHKQKEAVQAYLAAVNYADECIGVVLNALAKSEYANNTIVVLWGDHGWHLGEKLHYRKFVLWEESCKVPLMIVAPEITHAGTICTRPVNLIDLYPTLNELCGLTPKNDLEGVSIVPLLKNVGLKWERPSLTTMGQNRHSLRSEQYRFIQYEDGSEELYDHTIDPNEYKNLALNPEYKRILEYFRKWLPIINVPGIPAYNK